MKAIVDIDEEKLEVELSSNGRELQARVDGREYQLEASEPEPGVFLLKNDGKVYEVRSAPVGTHGQFDLSVRNSQFRAKVIDPKNLRGTATSDDHTSGQAVIKTAMPGKVVRILTVEGSAVSKGDGIIVVEAMKMQNEIKSPKDGIVTSIKAAEGDTVGAGDTLVIID